MQSEFLLFGPELLSAFPVKCVELLVDHGLLDELSKLRAGKTQGVERATMVVRNPACVDVRLGEEWVCLGPDEFRERPSLMLDVSEKLRAPCVRLATSVLLGMCTPWMLINAVWKAIQNHHMLPLVRRVVASLQAYNRANSFNSFNFYPNLQPHPFGYSMTVKAAVMAPIFSNQNVKSSEFVMRCIMPVVVALDSTWPESLAELPRKVTFTCTPAELQNILQEPGGSSRIPFGPLRVDIAHLDFLKELQATMSYTNLQWTGIAPSLPTFTEMRAVWVFMTGQPLPRREVTMAIARYAVLRSICGDVSFSQAEFNIALIARELRSISETEFEMTVPPGEMAPWVKKQVTEYALLSAAGQEVKEEHAVSQQLTHLVNQWLELIKKAHGEVSMQSAFDFLTKKNNNLIGLCYWIQRQLVSHDGDLLRLIHLRKQLAMDGGDSFGARMWLHNAAMEVLYTCIEENLSVVPAYYKPLCVPDDLLIYPTKKIACIQTA